MNIADAWINFILFGGKEPESLVNKPPKVKLPISNCLECGLPLDIGDHTECLRKSIEIIESFAP